MIKYFIGTIEIDRGGGFSVETFLFTCYQTRPGKRLWQIATEWFPSLSEVNEKRQIIHFNNWTITVKPSVWLEVSQDIYKQISLIIQEVK